MYFYTTALVLLGNCGAENSSRHPFFTCLKFLTLGKNELGDRKQRGAHCTAVSGIFRVISPLWMLTGKVYLPPNEEPVFFFFLNELCNVHYQPNKCTERHVIKTAE